MFIVAAVRYGYALYNAGQFAAVDSLAEVLAPRRSVLSPFETQYLNRLLGWTHGDNQAFYAAAKEMGRMAPQSNFARYTAARSAIFVNRMGEARAGLLTVDNESPDLAGIEGGYGDLCDVSHHLADHEGELKWAQEWSAHARNQQPLRSRGCEAVALVGLGRVAEVDAPFSQLLIPRREGTTSPIAYAVRTVAELRWHGHDSTARRLSRLALERAGAALSPTERLTFLVYSGNSERAGVMADSLSRADTASGPVRFWVGALAAARQDSARARAMLRQLEQGAPPYDRGQTTRARAEILALLGEKDQAVQLLQQAFAEGATFQGAGFHARFGLEPLRGFPPFEAFVKPR